MFGYRVPAPDQAMLISGGRRWRGGVGAPFRVVVGHGAFVLPFFRKARYLTLAMCEAEVAETCVTRQGISLNVRSVIAFKVGNDDESIVNAGQRFLSDQDQMSTLTGRIFAGHLRSIIGSMTVEEIVTERQKLATEVLDGSKAEMAKIGLTVDSLQIQSIDDHELRLHRRDGRPAQRRYPAPGADRPGAGHPAGRRGTAGSPAQAGRVRPADGGRAGRSTRPRSTRRRRRPHRWDRSPKRRRRWRSSAAQAELARQQAELRERQLVAEVVKPAEAEAERVRIMAKADAERMRIQAEAAASHDRVALDRMLIDQLPLIVKEAAGGLAGANVNVLNGAEGLSEVAAGLVGQGLTILDSIKKNLATSPESAADASPSANGSAPEGAPTAGHPAIEGTPGA